MVPPPSQMAPPTSSQTQNAPYTPAYHPQFANATPFMPRSGLSYPPPPGSSLPPPPTSTIPPPPVGQPSSDPSASSLPQEQSSTHSHFTGPHSRTGITAAQLYSLNVVGSGRRRHTWMMCEEIPVSRPANQSAAENAQQQPEAPKDTKVALNLAFYWPAAESEQFERPDQSEPNPAPRRRRVPSLLQLEGRRRLDQRGFPRFP